MAGEVPAQQPDVKEVPAKKSSSTEGLTFGSSDISFPLSLNFNRKVQLQRPLLSPKLVK